MMLSPLLFIIFIPITWIAYRNAPFKTALRVTFSFSIVPLAIFLMFENYSFFADHLPTLFGTFTTISKAGGSIKGVSVLAALITCPLAVLGCYLWYKLHYFIDRKILLGREPKPLSDAEQEIRLLNTMWMGIFISSLLLSIILCTGIANIFHRFQIEANLLGMILIFSTLPAITITMYCKRRWRLNVGGRKVAEVGSQPERVEPDCASQ